MMFQKLRLRLTIFNVAIISGILSIIALMIILEAPNSVISKLYYEMSLLASGQENIQVAFFKHRLHRQDYLVVQTDLTGKISIEPGYKRQLSSEEIASLVGSANKATVRQGQTLLENGETYYFLKTDRNSATVIVFRDQKGIIHQFILRTILVLIISVVLVLWASLNITANALKPIQNSWQRQIDFTADASHELRTPLAVIQANLELIMQNSEETVDSQQKWLANIMFETQRMVRLVEDLLTLSRSDANLQNLELSTFMLDEIIKAAIIPYRPLAAQKQIGLKLVLQSGIEFCGDQKRIQQLIVLLLDNALKYNRLGGTVTIELKQKNKKVELIVADTGIGIPTEHLNKIFDRFYRVNQVQNSDADGSGLGLAIAKWIVTEHKGKIQVESEVNQGTRFVTTFPVP